MLLCLLHSDFFQNALSANLNQSASLSKMRIEHLKPALLFFFHFGIGARWLERIEFSVTFSSISPLTSFLPINAQMANTRRKCNVPMIFCMIPSTLSATFTTNPRVIGQNTHTHTLVILSTMKSKQRFLHRPGVLSMCVSNTQRTYKMLIKVAANCL